MEKNNLYLILFLLTLINGCCEKPAPKLWVAKREMSVYKTHIGDSQIVAFKLRPGDICVPGDMVVEKVFRYTEVFCLGQGYGWVVDSNFDVFDKQSKKGAYISLPLSIGQKTPSGKISIFSASLSLSSSNFL